MPETSRAAASTENSAPPSKTRFVVLAVLCLLAGILYLDRICIQQALPSIKSELDLSNTEASYVLMAFTLAYGLFEVPTGRWGDRIGGRRVLTRIALWWSGFTAVTGACNGLGILMVVRFLFGAGEAGAFPNVARVLSRWFPDAERGRVQGILLAASLAGGALAPYLAAHLIEDIGWRLTFVVFGMVGVIWALGFWWWFRDNPASHRGVNAAEAAYIGCRATSQNTHEEIPWSLVLANPSVWSLSLIMALGSFNSYIYFSWFSTYLIEGRGVEKTASGLMSSTVLAFAAIGTFFGGVVLDWFAPAGQDARRRFQGSVSFFAATALLAGALLASDTWIAVVLTGASCFMAQSTQPLWWSSTIGISGRHVGALFGLMNSVGVVGALSSQFLVGWIADWLHRHGYSGRTQRDPLFYINLVVLTMAGILWSRFQYCVVEQIEDSDLSVRQQVQAAIDQDTANALTARNHERLA